mmetsp:Transcript_71918/g.192043  ORF Transcript_71918/g.192043 Transcript_71918/m.192043 type:complete len:102 (+) Transcript_71918:1333-1638(+)
MGRYYILTRRRHCFASPPPEANLKPLNLGMPQTSWNVQNILECLKHHGASQRLSRTALSDDDSDFPSRPPLACFHPKTFEPVFFIVLAVATDARPAVQSAM